MTVDWQMVPDFFIDNNFMGDWSLTTAAPVKLVEVLDGSVGCLRLCGHSLELDTIL